MLLFCKQLITRLQFVLKIIYLLWSRVPSGLGHSGLRLRLLGSCLCCFVENPAKVKTWQFFCRKTTDAGRHVGFFTGMAKFTRDFWMILLDKVDQYFVWGLLGSRRFPSLS